MVLAGRPKKRPPGQREYCLEVESDFSRNRSGRHVVGSTKGGQEVVQRDFVRHIDDRYASAPLEAVAVE